MGVSRPAPARTGHAAISVAAPYLAPALILGLQLVVFPLPLGVFVRGVLVGGVTALIALGMALIYRSNRIVNFAQGDLGAAPAVLVFLLLTELDWPYPIAALAGAAAAFALGAAVDVAVVRRFRRSPRLVLTVATIGLAQVLTGIAVLLPRAFGIESSLVAPRIDDPFDVRVEIGGTIFRGNSVVALVVTPIAIAGLAWFLQRTRSGVAVRAAADRADRAATLGVPVRRLQTLVWGLAALLAFTATFLRAGILGLPVGSVLSLGILLRSLTALLLGGMTRLTVIASSAVALGVLELGIDWHQGGALPLLGVETPPLDAVLALVVLVALLGRRRGTARTALDDQSTWQSVDEVRPVPERLRSLPEVRWTRVGFGAFLVAGLVLFPHLVAVDASLKASAVFVYAILALSLVVLTGWAGQVSLGQVAFFAIGAAVAGKATLAWSLDLSLAVLLAGVVGAVVATVVGLPALRFRGFHLAVTTFAFALATTSYLLDRAWFEWVPSQRVERLPLFGRIDIDTPTRIYYVILAALVLVLAGLRGIRASRTGRALVALRDNERNAQAYGIDATRATLTAFALSGFVAAVAGALFVHHQQAFGETSYAPAENLAVFAMAVVGGITSLPGAVLGAAYLLATRWFLPVQWQFLASGVGVLLVLLVLPGGLGGLVHRLRDRVLRDVATRRGIDAPGFTPETAADGMEAPGPVSSPPVSADALLDVRGLEAGYDGVPVLFGVDLAVEPGEIVALVGTNGAGKSTLLAAVTGVLPPTAGSVRLADEDITSRPAHAVAALGVAQVPGGRGVFPSLTVDENLVVAAWLVDDDLLAPARQRVDALFPALAERRNVPAGDLSGGQQQMLALSMAMLGTPRLLLIDELSLGLAPVVVGQLLPVVADLRDAGTTVVLVEQSIGVALDVADRAVVLDRGEVRWSGPAAELHADHDVFRTVFLAGGDRPNDGAPPQALPTTTPGPTSSVVAPAPSPTSPPDASPALQARRLRRSFGGILAVADVDLDVHVGEIVGILGPNGAGKTTVFDLLSGFVSADAGQISLGADDVTALGAAARARAGLGRSFQDSRLFPSLTVEETIAVALERWLTSRDPVSAALHLPQAYDSELAAGRRVSELVELLGLGVHRNKFVRELSTGTRRIVDLAALLAHRPTVVLLDEPSSGIAQREIDALGPMLRRIRDETGASLVVIEHDVALLRDVSDRLVAMDQGAVVTAGPPDQVLSHHAVVESYLGPGAATTRRRPSPVH